MENIILADAECELCGGEGMLLEPISGMEFECYCVREKRVELESESLLEFV